MTTPPLPHLASLGEFGLISRIAAQVSPCDGVITGIGDDAAVTALTPGMQLLTSTDMLVEDVHFRRSWHDPHRLGRKSLAVSVSDIAAMGGIPRWALLSLALPADLPLEFVDEFMRGFLAVTREHGIALIGGDTCSSRGGIVISVTIFGEQRPDMIVRRSGARPGDDIWVTGTLGDAALGLNMVESGMHADDYLAGRLLDPTPRVTAALSLVDQGVATAMIDISDGVLADFGHIADQSGVGGCVYADLLPLSHEFRSRAQHLSGSPHRLALSGGEDYELCFTADPLHREKIDECMKKCGVAMSRIGIVTPPSGVTVVTPDGGTLLPNTDGFNHFS